MSGVFTGASMIKTFEQKIQEYAKVQPTLYNYFKMNGLVKQIPEGLTEYTIIDAKEPRGAQMGSNIHDPPIISPQFGETTIALATLTARIQIGQEEIDMYKNHRNFGGNLVQDTVARFMPVVINQIDQFLAWGDEMRNPVDAIDPIRGKGLFTGIFNGGTAIGGGASGDNVVTAANAYVATVGTMYNALRAAGMYQAKYPLFSDTTNTLKADTATNHIYANTGSTELAKVLQKPYVQMWEDSPNFLDYTAAKYRMVMLCPRVKTATGGVVPTMTLYQSDNLRLLPQYQGGLDNNYVEYDVIWRGALRIHYTTAVQRTGTLTVA